MADKNQDKNQSKNRAEQAEEHDESVLNPEIKNESDLSKKERRLIEKEKLKGMGPDVYKRQDHGFDKVLAVFAEYPCNTDDKELINCAGYGKFTVQLCLSIDI